MKGPSGVLALVLAETAAGTTALLWLTGLWGRVKRGFFVLTGATALVSAILTTLAAVAAVETSAGSEADAAVLLAAGGAVVLGLSLASLILHLDTAGRALGLTAVPIAAAMLVAFARVSGPSLLASTLQLGAGAAFMGAVTDGLLLGHWYLVDRRLPRDHIQRFALLLLVAVVLEAVAVAVGGFGERATATGISPVLGVSGLSTWLALGMVAMTAFIAWMIRASLRTPRARAIQAATGFFYLAVITAFTAEMAAKVDFVG